MRLATRIFWASVLLVCAPAAVAWSMGLYDAVEARRLTAELEDLSRATLEAGDLSDAALARLGSAQRVYVRRLDAEGRVRFASDPALAEGPFQRRGWVRDVADFFFGPGGPPDLASWEAELGPPARRPEVQAVLQGAPAADRMRVTSRMQVFSRAARAPEGGILYLTRASRRSVRALYDFRFQMLKLTLGLLVGALAMGAWLAYQIVGPVNRLEARVQAFLRGEDKGPLALARSDEIGELSRSFDALRARLQARAELSTRVTEDLAHDLKSPLAAVRAAAELLEGDGPLEPERRARLAATVGAAAGHMERSIDALTALARLEAQLEAEPVEVFDLAAEVREVVEARRADPRAERRALTLEAPERLRVRGHPARLRAAVDNLLDNALDFAARRVEVTLRADAAQVTLRVADDGPGVSPGNRDRIFERFFTRRPEGAGEGTGLGLSIVRAVAEAHGGAVRLLEEGRGATFELTLPR